MAVGGYGRRELCAGSDVDLMLLHAGRGDIAEVADRVWYPLWDAGLRLGHSVRSVREALSLAAGDLDTATSLLDARLVAGDCDLASVLASEGLRQWRRRAGRWIDLMEAQSRERHGRAGEVAFLLEPDLKEGKGGLRDVHVNRWAAAAEPAMAPPPAVEQAHEVLLAVRVELHRRSTRSDRLLLQEQDAIAAALGYADADALMAAVSGAARTIAWSTDEAWRRRRRQGRRVRPVPVGPDLVQVADELALAAGADLSDPSLTLRAAGAAAERGLALAPEALERLQASPAPGAPWPPAARDGLVAALRAGHAAIPVLEALDQCGLLVRVLPEWERVRHRPQRNAYHRFTVDRHLCETAANAAALTQGVSRPDLLLVGALLHDIGKGFPGDHTDAGVEVVARIGSRMGFPPEDVAVLQAMVRLHLLLPDVATRRDLDDPDTIRSVAEAVGDLTTLELLHRLTEADSLATGPSAWGTWKAGLVAELVAKVRQVLAEGPESLSPTATLPTPEHRALMAERRLQVVPDRESLTIVAPDRPGLFCRVAGTLALHGLDVLSAVAASSEDGMAVEIFRVEPAHGQDPDWAGFEADLARALTGRLALEARLGDRVRTYERGMPAGPPLPAPRVMVDNDASASATVVEVRAPDGVGVLYRITRVLADCDLDVRTAKVQTLGQEVVDTFYVRDAAGAKLDREEDVAELTRALLAALAG